MLIVFLVVAVSCRPWRLTGGRQPNPTFANVGLARRRRPLCVCAWSALSSCALQCQHSYLSIAQGVVSWDTSKGPRLQALHPASAVSLRRKPRHPACLSSTGLRSSSACHSSALSCPESQVGTQPPRPAAASAFPGLTPRCRARLSKALLCLPLPSLDHLEHLSPRHGVWCRVGTLVQDLGAYSPQGGPWRAWELLVTPGFCSHRRSRLLLLLIMGGCVHASHLLYPLERVLHLQSKRTAPLAQWRCSNTTALHLPRR
jgi:hypothetical protein